MKKIIKLTLLAGLIGGIAFGAMNFSRYDIYRIEYKVTESILNFADNNGVTTLIHQFKEFMNQI